MTRLPEPFLPLHDSDFKRLANLDAVTWGTSGRTHPGLSVFAKVGNRMGTARRCNLARLLFTLQKHQWFMAISGTAHLEVAQILIRVSASIITSLTYLNLPTKSTDLLTRPRFLDHFRFAMYHADRIIEESFENPLILPDDYIGELKRAGLLQ